MKALQTKGEKFRADTEVVIIRHVAIGQIGGTSALFDKLGADERPSNKSKKGSAKGSVALLKEPFQLGCVSQDS